MRTGSLPAVTAPELCGGPSSLLDYCFDSALIDARLGTSVVVLCTRRFRKRLHPKNTHIRTGRAAYPLRSRR